MSKDPVIDADGHIIEDKEKLRSYLEPPYNRRGGSLVSAEPWDGHLNGTLPRNKEWSPHRPSANDWLRIMDNHNMEFAYLYSTSAGDVSAVREKDYAIALCRAYNNYVHDDFVKVSPRLKPLAIFPQQDPQEAAREIRRAVKELGLAGVSIKTTGLTLPLGHRFYDPIYEEAQSLGCLLGVHGTRKGTQELASGMFETFTEVHTVAFPVGIFQQFTSILFQGVPERFPRLRMAFLEIGCTWLPYWLDRMNEHWELRGHVETPELKRLPSEVVRDRPIYFSVEAGETLLPETLKYVGDDHFVYASDIPHWDNEFPDSMYKIESRADLSESQKRKILYDNAKAMYGGR
jgi:uncharacterized protein